MPTTRSNRQLESEGEPAPIAPTTRQRHTARARAQVNRGGGLPGGRNQGGGHVGGRTLRRSVSTPNLDEGEREDVFFDDEDEDVGKTLHAKDGKVKYMEQ